MLSRMSLRLMAEPSERDLIRRKRLSALAEYRALVSRGYTPGAARERVGL